MKREEEPDVVMITTDRRPDPIVWIIGAKDDDRLHAVPGGNSESVDNAGSR